MTYCLVVLFRDFLSCSVNKSRLRVPTVFEAGTGL